MVHCGYAFMLAVSSVYMAIASPQTEQEFTQILNNKEKNIYNSIREERLHIYYKSFFFSILISIKMYATLLVFY